MTRQRLFWMTTVCEGALVDKLPVSRVDWVQVSEARALAKWTKRKYGV